MIPSPPSPGLTPRLWSGLLFKALGGAFLGIAATAAPDGIHHIRIDGDFSDWAAVRSDGDATGGPGVLHDGIPDTHDTDHAEPNDIPAFVNHPDIDLVEFKFTHDATNLYAYFRATGQIGRTANSGTLRGRYYVIVTLDVDNDAETGYAVRGSDYHG